MSSLRDSPVRQRLHAGGASSRHACSILVQWAVRKYPGPTEARNVDMRAAHVLASGTLGAVINARLCRSGCSPLVHECMSRNLSELHHVTERYRLLVIGSGSDRRSALASLQKSSTIVRSTLREHIRMLGRSITKDWGYVRLGQGFGRGSERLSSPNSGDLVLSAVVSDVTVLPDPCGSAAQASCVASL